MIIKGVVCVGNFEPLILINWIQTFKTGFWVQNHLLNLCTSAVNSQMLLCSQKAGVKAFWYTNTLTC